MRPRLLAAILVLGTTLCACRGCRSSSGDAVLDAAPAPLPALPSARPSPPLGKPRPEVDGEHAAALSKNPGDVAFVVRTEGERQQFYVGERIVLVLTFSSTAPEKYELDTATHDNSGRVTLDRYQFDHEVEDPLAGYFAMGGPSGGARSVPPLRNEPVVVKVDLNEHARFEAPGKLRFFITTSRVGALAVTSNLVELELVDDPAWADRELAQVTPKLAPDHTDDGDADVARRTLRFLGTPRAARALVDDMCSVNSGSRFQTTLGIYASRHRAWIHAMLERGLVEPDCAIGWETWDFIRRMNVDRADEHGRLLIEAIASKNGRALAPSLVMALQLMFENEKATKKRHPKHDELIAKLATILTTVPDSVLQSLLEQNWHLARSPVMKGPLLELAKQARPRDTSLALRSMSDVALERTIELDYAQARTFILAELGRPDGPRPAFVAATLAKLEEKELPGLDASLLAGLEKTDFATLERNADLVTRYASGAIVEKVWPRYREKPRERRSLLAYLSKHDPARAEAEIRTLDASAVDGLAKWVWTPAMEDIAIKALHKARHERDTAIDTLGKHGTPKARAALLDRVREAHAKPREPGPRDDRHFLIQSLHGALRDADGWITTGEDLMSMRESCDDDHCREQLKLTADRWGQDSKHPDLVLWDSDEGEVTGWIAQYSVHTMAEVEHRLRQMPEGFTLVWGTKPVDVASVKMDRVRALAAERKVTIVSKR